MKEIWFNGIKFTKDDKTGYYLNSSIRKRLHRYVWELHYGEIPEGYHIHHIDFDKSNNDISNFYCNNQYNIWKYWWNYWRIIIPYIRGFVVIT